MIGAITGEEGLQMAKDHPPDMILLDIMLPGQLSGRDVLQKLKEDSTTRTIPVAILSNLDDQRKLPFSLGNIDYMLKANTPLEDVVAVVKKHMENGNNPVSAS